MSLIKRDHFYEDGVLVPSRVFQALDIWQQAADAEAKLRAETQQQLREAAQVANEAAALAERYGEAIIAIHEALPNELRVRAIIAALDTELGS